MIVLVPSARTEEAPWLNHRSVGITVSRLVEKHKSRRPQIEYDWLYKLICYMVMPIAAKDEQAHTCTTTLLWGRLRCVDPINNVPDQLHCESNVNEAVRTVSIYHEMPNEIHNNRRRSTGCCILFIKVFGAINLWEYKPQRRTP